MDTLKEKGILQCAGQTKTLEDIMLSEMSLSHKATAVDCACTSSWVVQRERKGGLHEPARGRVGA